MRPDRLIRANYPVIVINRFEETRVATAVAEVASKREHTVWSWGVSRGLEQVSGAGQG